MKFGATNNRETEASISEVPWSPASLPEETSAVTNTDLVECTGTQRRFPCDCETAKRDRNLVFYFLATEQPLGHDLPVKEGSLSEMTPYQVT